MLGLGRIGGVINPGTARRPLQPTERTLAALSVSDCPSSCAVWLQKKCH